MTSPPTIRVRPGAATILGPALRARTRAATMAPAVTLLAALRLRATAWERWELGPAAARPARARAAWVLGQAARVLGRAARVPVAPARVPVAPARVPVAPARVPVA